MEQRSKQARNWHAVNAWNRSSAGPINDKRRERLDREKKAQHRAKGLKNLSLSDLDEDDYLDLWD